MTGRRLSNALVVVLILVAFAASAGGVQDAAAAEELPTLRYLGTGGGDDPNELWGAKMLEEQTGYMVEYERLSRENVPEALSLVIISGEVYDVVQTYGNRSGLKELVMDFARRGALTQLDDLISQYGANIRRGIPESSMNIFRVNGNTYILPAKIPVDRSDWNVMARMDWLQTLGLDEPTTTEEFANALRTLRDEDPGNLGERLLPFVIGPPNQVHGVLGAFGIANDWNVVGDRMVAREELPGFKDYLAYMRGLYEEGLLDPEFPINKRSNLLEKFSSGRAAFVMMRVWSLGGVDDALQKNAPGYSWAYLDPLIGPNGDQGLYQQYSYDFISFVPKASRHPDHAVRWIDAKLDPETFKLQSIGIEGVHHVANADGTYSPIQPKFFDELNAQPYFLVGSDEESYSVYWMTRAQKDARMYRGFLELNVPAEQARWGKLDYIGIAAGLTVWGEKAQQLLTMTNDFMTQVIAGVEPLSAVDDYVARWRAEGGAAASAEINSWYREFRAAQ